MTPTDTMDPATVPTAVARASAPVNWPVGSVLVVGLHPAYAYRLPRDGSQMVLMLSCWLNRPRLGS
jgi:hypothetical protein